MFELTTEWLFKYYGSSRHGEDFHTARWLRNHGKDVQPGQPEEWKQWKHLVEYQPNCVGIVPKVLARIGTPFESELDAHAWINYQRVPMHADGYVQACGKYKPKTILELGVGGDSAISTAQFLRHIETMGEGKMLSVDLNPLGITWIRYKDYPFWTFRQADSLVVLNEMIKSNTRWDVIFLDTLPYYQHTLKELDLACQITDHILLDDITMEALEHDKEGGKKRAVLEWVPKHPEWERVDYDPPGSHAIVVGSLIRGDADVYKRKRVLRRRTF
jgi:hypothetical protein